MSWKLILPMQLCKPLIESATSFRNREDTAQRNTGPKYMLEVKALRDMPPEKKPKNEELEVCPFVTTSSGLVKTGIDAAAPLDVISRTLDQPNWWYWKFHEPAE